MYLERDKLDTSKLLRIGLPFLIAAGLLLLGVGLVSAQGPGSLTRLTTGSDSDRISGNPSQSADGTQVAFQSDSDFLGQGIPNDQTEIWLYDTATMTVTRATIASAAGRRSEYPSINADGTKMAFQSDSDFLGQGVPAGQIEIWVYDTAAMTVTRVTNASHAGRDSKDASINADGTKIAFESVSDFLGQGIPATQSEIWLYDTATMTVTRVTTASSFGRASFDPSISADGTRIAFVSDSDFLGQGTPGFVYEIWLYDTTTKTFTRVTTVAGAGRDSYQPNISANGSKVAFSSDSDFLGQGIPDNQYEVWLYDTSTMTVTRVTSASDSNRYSQYPSVSADGTQIAFSGDSDFLGQGVPDNQSEVWLYSSATKTITRVTTSSAPGLESERPSIRADGSRVAFDSDSDFLSQGNVQDDEIWLWEGLPVLELTKTVDDSTPLIGEPFQYTIVVRNNGIGHATSGVVSDILDSGLKLAGTVTLDPPGAGTIGSLPVLASGLTINGGERITLTVPVKVKATGVTSGTVIPNTAEVTSAETSGSASGSVSITARKAPVDPPVAGEAMIYLPMVVRPKN